MSHEAAALTVSSQPGACLNGAQLAALNSSPVLAHPDSYKVRVAEKGDLEAIFRLRYEVFFDEMGADASKNLHKGLDVDGFDAFCDHMVVTFGSLIVGTYRLLPNARLSGKHVNLYTESEFDISAIKSRFGNKLLELGRSCVHAEHRNGIVPRLLWAGVAEYVQTHDIEAVIGCVSVHGLSHDVAASMEDFLKDKGHWTSDSEFHANVCESFRTPSSGDSERSGRSEHNSTEVLVQNPLHLFPPLLKGYLNLGAKVAGGPAFDKDFGTHDFLMLLEKSKMNPKYSRSLLNRATRRNSEPSGWTPELRLMETPV